MARTVKIVYQSDYGCYEHEVEPLVPRIEELSGKPFDIDRHSRTNPYLVQAVEEVLSKPEGERWNFDLAIEELPEGTLWQIDYYDGKESIYTEARHPWRVAEVKE